MLNGIGDARDEVEQDGDQVCHGYRDCLALIEKGDFESAAVVIAELWPLDPRYASALGDKLEVARRWQRAREDAVETRKFWEWMDLRR